MPEYADRITALQADLNVFRSMFEEASQKSVEWGRVARQAQTDIVQIEQTISLYERRARQTYLASPPDLFESEVDVHTAEAESISDNGAIKEAVLQPSDNTGSLSKEVGRAEPKSVSIDTVRQFLHNSYHIQNYARSISDHKEFFLENGMDPSRDQLRRAIDQALSSGTLYKLSYGSSRRYIWYVLPKMTAENQKGNLVLADESYLPRGVSLNDRSQYKVTAMA